MVGCAYAWAVKGIGKRDRLKIGWAYTPDLRYLAFAARKPLQNLSFTQ